MSHSCRGVIDIEVKVKVRDTRVLDVLQDEWTLNFKTFN